jgi:hypothetical protein
VPVEPELRRIVYWSQTIRNARCTAGDRFEINSVRPGRYLAFALHSLANLQFMSNLPSLPSNGVTVDVTTVSAFMIATVSVAPAR